MPEPLSVSPAQLTAAAATAEVIAQLLGNAVRLAEGPIDHAGTPTAGWLTSAATGEVVAYALHRLTAIAQDLSATSAALYATAEAYRAADDRAARRYPSGRLGPGTGRPQVTPW